MCFMPGLDRAAEVEAAKALALQKAQTAGFRATTAKWRSMEAIR
jgi:hypothetical protein